MRLTNENLLSVKKTATKKKTKKRSRHFLCQQSSQAGAKNYSTISTMIAKYGKVDNVLPWDDQLSKHFLRPTFIVRPRQPKTVGFADQVKNWDGGSVGDTIGMMVLFVMMPTMVLALNS